VYSDHQLAIYQVDKVLLPRDFFVPKSPPPAPAPEMSKDSKKKSAEGPASADDTDKSDAMSLKDKNGVVDCCSCCCNCVFYITPFRNVSSEITQIRIVASEA
ncbi:fasciclin-like arabinogalactan protein, partial [Trifolium medium]|nr:fasciclin-like arabinogalactan protein [Trifolium medium]